VLIWSWWRNLHFVSENNRATEAKECTQEPACTRHAFEAHADDGCWWRGRVIGRGLEWTRSTAARTTSTRCDYEGVFDGSAPQVRSSLCCSTRLFADAQTPRKLQIDTCHHLALTNCKCPEPIDSVHTGRAAKNIGTRILHRQWRPVQGGQGGAKLNRRFKYSKYRPTRKVFEDGEMMTCCAVVDNGTTNFPYLEY